MVPAGRHMPCRLCASCQQEKSIRGVWYLVDVTPESASPFLCESCYRQAHPAAAGALVGPTIEDALATRSASPGSRLLS